jgi:hypothetical protein
MGADNAETRHAGIVAEATDLCWKATPFGSDEDDHITSYLLPAGVVHRLIGALQGAGYPASFRGVGDA